MKKLIVLSMLFVLTVAASACAQEPKAENLGKPEQQMDKVSYSIGLNLGKSFKQQGVEGVNLEFLVQGLRDGLGDAETLLTEEEINTTMQTFQQEMMELQQTRQAEAAEKNKVEGAAFLAANKDKEGVVMTQSGLQYIVVEPGDGPSPTPEDTVTVHYTGTLVDGTKFDSSVDRGQPATFPVGGVIPGWTEALQLMKVGSKFKLFIPSDLAYGERQAGPTIGPNSVLVFDVELLSIEPKAEGGATP